jgi:hypothetical protein
MTVLPHLAAARPPEEGLSEVLPWLLVLLGAVIIGGIILVAVRRTLRSGGGGPPADAGFTLQDLRDLHAAGELSDDEFARARDAMIERVKGATSENVEDADPRDPNDADA